LVNTGIEKNPDMLVLDLKKNIKKGNFLGYFEAFFLNFHTDLKSA
jgi:hypothetical protein